MTLLKQKAQAVKDEWVGDGTVNGLMDLIKAILAMPEMPTDSELEQQAIGFLHDSNFVEAGKLIVLDFYQAIKTYKAAYRAAISKVRE